MVVVGGARKACVGRDRVNKKMVKEMCVVVAVGGKGCVLGMYVVVIWGFA